MKRAALVSIMAFLIPLSGCPVVHNFDSQLNILHADLVRARRDGRDIASVEQQLAQLARDASKDAVGKSPKDAVALYRVAAVAAWQAGPAGASLVLPITDAGTAACVALPHKAKDAPRDCSLIRIARPMAVQDGLAGTLAALQRKKSDVQRDHKRHCGELQGTEAETCLRERGKLPATDLPAVQTLFNDFETQFDKASDIRADLSGLDLPPEFIPQTDNQRLIIYCNAVAAWSLSADVEDGNATFGRLTPRKAAMAQQLQGSGVQPNCGQGMPMQTANGGLRSSGQ